MKIGVLGTGDVGKVLSSGLSAAGHEVMIGTRDPSSGALDEWLEGAGRGIDCGSFEAAARFAELIIFAVGWAHAQSVIELAGSSNFDGKVVLDATNPLDFAQPGQPPVLAIGHDDSGGEQVQRWLPAAKVVKWFNMIGNPHMVNPDFGGEKPDMFICGNDASAKAVADRLAQDLGWPPCIDLGDISRSRYLEPLAMVWITHFFDSNFNGDFAFKLIRK